MPAWPLAVRPAQYTANTLPLFRANRTSAGMTAETNDDKGGVNPGNPIDKGARLGSL